LCRCENGIWHLCKQEEQASDDHANAENDLFSEKDSARMGQFIRDVMKVQVSVLDGVLAASEP
jgi:hypothetical protein